MVAKLQPLEKLDPPEPSKPWPPTVADLWGRRWAAHLSRGAGFGASREELAEAEKLGHEGTLDLLLRGRPQADELLPVFLDSGRVAATRDDAGGSLIRAWWLY